MFYLIFLGGSSGVANGESLTMTGQIIFKISFKQLTFVGNELYH